MRLQHGGEVPREAVVALYEANGWTAYTRDPDALMRAIAGSTHVRLHVLLTDGTPRQRAFYTALGFTEATEHAPPLVAYVRFAR